MKELKLTQFNNSDSSQQWRTISDRVMGGVSDSLISAKRGILHFTGQVSLENNGGFAMIRSTFDTINPTGFNAFRLIIKGDGKRYQFRVKEIAGQRHSYIQHFETTGDWQTIIIEFEELKPWFRGTHLDLDDFQGSKLSSVAFLIANKAEQTFHLQIESISLVNQ